MRVNPTKSFLRLGLFCAVLGVPAAGVLACVDALHLDPAGTTSSSTGTGGSKGDAGTDGGLTCHSNPDCPYPTPVCNTVTDTCVQCLVISDCAAIPGSVCSQGSCVCPSAGDAGTLGPCLSSEWKVISSIDAPEARSHHVAVWMGSQMFVWGGMNNAPDPLNTGGVYDLPTDTWTPTSVPAALDGRSDATAVWDDVDNLVLIWGGVGAGPTLLNDGWRYDPATDTWTAMASLNPPSVDGGAGDGGADAGVAFAPRTNHTAVWATGLSIGPMMKTTAAMIIWGGITDTSGTTIDDGQIYDPAANQWVGPIPSGMGAPGMPGPRAFHAAVWSSNGYMLIFGGASGPMTLADGILYDLTPGPPDAGGGTWNTIAGSSPPGAREKHTGVWDPMGMAMLVWGGYDGAASPTYFQDGSSLSMSMSMGTNWTAFSGTGSLPAGRVDHSSVVLAGPTGSQLVIFGGDNATGTLASGWSFDTSPGGRWSPLPTPGPSARQNHTAVATTTPGSTTPGSSMIVWGGETATAVYSNEGWIYTPQ